jgi:hypothetical protein
VKYELHGERLEHPVTTPTTPAGRALLEHLSAVGVDLGGCPFPGCELAADHIGDHSIPDVWLNRDAPSWVAEDAILAIEQEARADLRAATPPASALLLPDGRSVHVNLMDGRCRCGATFTGGWKGYAFHLDEVILLFRPVTLHADAAIRGARPMTSPLEQRDGLREALERVKAALTDEDEIAHGEAWSLAPLRGLGICAYCEGNWPCRTQRGIDRLLEAIGAALAQPAERTLDEAWAECEALLPEGWVLDGLRRLYDGGMPSDHWVARAVHPVEVEWDGVDIGTCPREQIEGPTPIAALDALAAALRGRDARGAR